MFSWSLLYVVRGVVSVGSMGSLEPTDFLKALNGTHGFGAKGLHPRRPIYPNCSMQKFLEPTGGNS